MSDFNSLVTGTDNLTGLAPSQDPERNRIRSMLEQHPIEQQQQPQPQGDDRDAIRKALDADWKKQRADAEQMVLSTLSEATKANPDTRAEATKIARQMKVDDIDHVERNMDVMRQMAQQRAVSQMELTRYSPRLAEHLQDLEFARMAHDDVPNLSGWELVQGRWESARTQIELAGLADKMRWGRATPEELARIGVLRVKMKELPQDSNWNPIAAGAYVMGQLWDTMPKAVATGLATGGAYAGMTALAGQAGPQAAVPEELVTVPTGFGAGFIRGFAGAMFLQTADIEGGLAYLDMLDSGYSESAAKWASMGVGVVNGMLEVAGERLVAKPILDVLRRDVARSMTQRTLGVALKQFGKDYLIGMGGELSTEVAQELTQIAGEEIARQLSPNSGELQSDFTRGQILPRLAAVAKETFLGMSLVGGLAPTVRFAHDMSLAQQAVATHEVIKALATNADESKLSDRSTPAYAKFIRGASKGRIENFYMDGQTMADMLHQVDKAENGAGSKMLEQAAPEVYAQIAEAARTNGDVVIPSEVFASKLAKTDFGKSLVDHLRANPNAVSFADAKKTIGKREELFAQHAAEVEKEMGATSEFMASADVVDSAMQRRLAAAGVSKSMAAPQAKFYRNFVVTQAAEMRKNDPSMTPEKFDEENGLRVVKGDVAPDGAVRQLGTESPEFQAWFGESKVVDEAGKPLVVYHGTGAPGFEEFSKELRGTTTGARDAKLGFFFAGSGQMASEFAWQDGKQGGVYPAFLALKNPAVLDRDMLSPDSTGAFAKRLQEAVGAGHDGAIIRMRMGERVDTAYVAFHPEQIKSVNNRGTFDPNDPNILHAPGFRGSFDIGTNTAFLHKSANASTFLHEMSHYYLSMFSRLASQPGATPQMQADWQIILGWFGIKDNAAWLALSEKQRVKFHEQWAYNFEIYLSEGKAPSIELEGPFARFRAWMVRTYKSIRDELNSIYRGEFGVDLPALTPEVRAVMDRMVASEEAIKQYDAVYNPAVFQTEVEYVKNGGTAEDWLTYKAALDAYQQAAIRDLTSMSLGAVRWLGLAQKRADKDFQRERTAAIAETTAAVRAELEASPLYRTESQLRNGEAIDDTGKAVPMKLSKAQVEAVLAKQPELLKRFGKGKTSMLAANGASIDLVARMMGYDSGERMVMELATAPSLDAAVEANVAARMLQDSPEWLDPEYRQARIEQAVHNEARGKFLALQEKVLSRAARPNNLVRNAAKLTAQEILSHKTLREIKPHQFHIAESKSAGQARELLAKGDTAGALMAVRRQILNHELTRAAIDIEREADKVVRSFSRFTADNEKLGKTRNVDLIAVARAILAAYGLYKGKANPNDYLDILHRQDPSLYDKLQPLVEEANANAKPYRDLTWEAFQRLRDITDELWNESKASRQIELGDRKVVREEFKAQILAGLARIGVPDKAAGLKSFTATILDTKAILSQVEHWARFMDNDAVGPWSQMVRAIQSGLDTSRSQFVEQLKQMRSILKGLKFSRVEIPAQELGYTFGSESGGHGKAELFGAFLHDGNESNRSKNLIGRGWVPDMENPKNPDGTVDQTKWTAFKQRAIANGTWTEADMDAVQALWDLLDALLPQLQAAHRKMFGYNFDEVAHESFEMFGKKYRGGYVPASPDLNVEVAASRFENLEELQADFKNQMPAVPKNMTKTRTGVYRALFLDARQLIRHVDNVLRLINVQPAISTFLSIIRDPEIAGPLNKIDRSAIESMLLPYLVRVATQRVTMRGKTQLGDSIAGTLKRGAAASIMFLKPANAAQQFAGIINAANFVKPRHLMPGVWQTTRHPIDSTAMIVGKSKYMDLRLKNQIGDLQQDIREMLEKSTTYEEWKAWLAKNTYVLQRLAQNTVDRAVWVGAYNQSIVENGKAMAGEELESRAVADADSAVRLSQGANEAESIAAYRVGTPAYQTFIMFTGYWNTVLNGIVYSNHRMRAFMLLMAFPTVVSGAIMLAAAGGLGDRDDDGDTDAADFTRWILQEQAKAMLAMVPIAGPGVAVLGESMFGKTAQDDRLVNNPSVQVVASAARVFNLVGSKPLSDYSSRDWRDLATMFTTIFQIPVTPITNALGYARDVAIGKVRPQGPLGPQVDYIRGLVTGRASPQSR